MQPSPQLQTAIIALILAIMAPGAVVSTDGFIHGLVSSAPSNPGLPAVDSTSQRVTQEYMDGVVDRIIDKILGDPKGS
jgi:hypothetical protein